MSPLLQESSESAAAPFIENSQSTALSWEAVLSGIDRRPQPGRIEPEPAERLAALKSPYGDALDPRAA
jgi:hypothetical protein